MDQCWVLCRVQRSRWACSYSGVGVVQHNEDDEDVGAPGSLDGVGHPLLPLQEQTTAVGHDDQQLGRFWRQRGQRSEIREVEDLGLWI